MTVSQRVTRSISGVFIGAGLSLSLVARGAVPIANRLDLP